MLNSLHWRLFALLAALAAVVALAVGGATYLSVRNETDELFDYQLRQLALGLRDQGRIGEGERAALANPDFDFVVQVWTLDGVSVYSSQPQPRLPGRTVLGWSTLELRGEAWRVFSTATALSVVQVAQPLHVREALARQAAWRSVRPVMAAAPLVALLMWWVLGWSLAPLKNVQRALAERGAGDLAPLPTAALPDELRPLVDGFNRLLGRLEHAFGAQRGFVADAAHELRTPLTALKLQLLVLQGASDAAERQAALDRLRAGVDRATRLVEQLLALARSEPGALAPQQPVDLAALARAELQEAQTTADHATFSADLADGLPPVQGDPDALRAALRNLIDNALKYGGPAPRVHVSLDADGRWQRLRVDDSGPGVPAAEREQLFERFHRAVPGRGQGSGLGLAIVRATALRHGGQVRLDDAPGGGLRAELRLPAA